VFSVLCLLDAILFGFRFGLVPSMFLLTYGSAHLSENLLQLFVLCCSFGEVFRSVHCAVVLAEDTISFALASILFLQPV
jgi:hypothetical protein